MERYTWRTAGDRGAGGQSADIAHAIAALNAHLQQLAVHRASADIEGAIEGRDITAPFSISWGCGRDLTSLRWHIDELCEGLRAELHRAADLRTLGTAK